MTDILGPASAPNAVTTRPADLRSYGSVDTWFKDCSTPTAEDGTDIQAAYLNNVSSELRQVTRANGFLLDGVTPVVPEVAAAENLIRQSVQQMIQRGQTVFAMDVGAANAMIVNLAPALLEYKQGLRIVVIGAANNTGATTINVNGRGLKQVCRRDGSNLLVNDIMAGIVAELVYDGAKFVMPAANGQGALKNNLNLYVNGSIGSDSNDGSGPDAARAMATIQGAVNRAFSYGPGSFGVTISVANGSYGKVISPGVPGPVVTISGNATTPANVVVNGGNDHCFAVYGPNKFNVYGVKVVNTTGALNGGFVAINGGSIDTDLTASGAITGGVFEAFGSGSNVKVGSHHFGGNSRYWFWSTFAGFLTGFPGVVWTADIPLVVSQTAIALNNGVIEFGQTGSFALPGNVTGQRYLATLNGVIDTLGLGANFIPGTIAGGTTLGGQYA